MKKTKIGKRRNPDSCARWSCLSCPYYDCFLYRAIAGVTTAPQFEIGNDPSLSHEFQNYSGAVESARSLPKTQSKALSGVIILGTFIAAFVSVHRV